MSFTPEQIDALGAKLDPRHVSTRSQAGRQLSYIEAWHAIAEANRIFGFDGWSRETVEIRCVSERDRQEENKQGWRVGYIARVRVTVDGVVREGTGDGEGIDRHLAAAHGSAAKEAESDAMKRALMTFGNPFGLALYDKSRENVAAADQPQQQLPPPDRRPLSQQASPAAPRMSAQEWADGMRTAIVGADRTALSRLLKTNEAALEKLRDRAPAIYADLNGAISGRWDELNGRQAPPRVPSDSVFAAPPEHVNGGAR